MKDLISLSKKATLVNSNKTTYSSHVNKDTKIIIGVISDTHGAVSKSTLNALSGCNYIIHAGDMESTTTVATLSKIAKVTAVRGNMDRGDFAYGLKSTEVLSVANKNFYVIHNLAHLDLDPVKAEIDGIISGHTHIPSIEGREEVLYLNPGSASKPKYGKQPSIAFIEIVGDKIKARIEYIAQFY